MFFCEHVVFQLFELGGELLGVRVEELSAVRDVEFFGVPLKEQGVVVFFQLVDGLTDRGLGDVEVFGCGAHSLGLNDFDEDL